MKKNFSLLFLSVLFCFAAFAQDPGFSQFFASPLTLNPALTGKFNGDLRVAGNYRNQWPSINNAFITSTISVDMPILKDRLPDNNTWGVGVMGMTDRTANGILVSNYLGLMPPKRLTEQNFILRISLINRVGGQFPVRMPSAPSGQPSIILT